jgi:hypothetical protein
MTAKLWERVSNLSSLVASDPVLENETLYIMRSSQNTSNVPIGELSLHHDGRAVDINTTNFDAPALAILAIKAGFDFVHWGEDPGYLHASVIASECNAVLDLVFLVDSSG